MGQNSILKVGTRRSKLAIAQTNLVLEKLKESDPSLNFEIVTIETKGDQQHQNVEESWEERQKRQADKKKQPVFVMLAVMVVAEVGSAIK